MTDNGETRAAAGLPNRRTVKVVLDFTLYAEDPDEQLAEGFAEALFEHMSEGPQDLETFNYSVDGWDFAR